MRYTMNWFTKLFAPKWNTYDGLFSTPSVRFLARVPKSKKKVQIVRMRLVIDSETGEYLFPLCGPINEHGNFVKMDAWMPLPKP